jgi:DNA-directed RNA polymerase specialized sigma24 family protein
MPNPTGYLYRVGQSKARRRRLLPRPLWESPVSTDPWIEPGLGPALLALSKRQRQAVMLIEGYDHTFREAAALLGVSISSVQTHHRRGLERLRAALGVTTHD